MRIEKQREGRAERERGIGAVGAETVAGWRREEQLLLGHAGEDRTVTAELGGNDDERGEHGDEDQHVLDDGDQRRRAESARIGKGGEDDEGYDQRQVSDEASRRKAERADHHLHADDLERDIGHRRDNARQREGEREQPAAEAVADEVGGGDMAARARDLPQAREDDIENGIDEDGVGNGEETHRALAEDERRNGDERIGGVEVAAEQEPGDDGAEAAPAETPFVQHVEIGLAPMRRDEAEPGDEQKERDEDDRGGEIEIQRMSPGTPLGSPSSWASSVTCVTLLSIQ